MHKRSKNNAASAAAESYTHHGCQTSICICLCIRISLNHCFCANLLAFCMFSSIYIVFYCINVYPICTKHQKLCSKCSSNKVGTPWLPNWCLHMFVHQKAMENDWFSTKTTYPATSSAHTLAIMFVCTRCFKNAYQICGTCPWIIPDHPPYFCLALGKSLFACGGAHLLPKD